MSSSPKFISLQNMEPSNEVLFEFDQHQQSNDLFSEDFALTSNVVDELQPLEPPVQPIPVPDYQMEEANNSVVEVPPEDAKNSTASTEKLTQLPLTRIKHIMKLDPSLQMASQESVFVITKATELFIESLTRETVSFTVKNKKRTIQRRDVDAAIDAIGALSFLEGALD